MREREGGGEKERPPADGTGEEEKKMAHGFNSLPTSVYLEKQPLCHWVFLTACTGARVRPAMTAS